MLAVSKSIDRYLARQATDVIAGSLALGAKFILYIIR
jgi:hypothetical protein